MCRETIIPGFRTQCPTAIGGLATRLKFWRISRQKKNVHGTLEIRVYLAIEKNGEFFVKLSE